MAKKKSTPAPEIQNEVISNWIESNANRLTEIANENPPLYGAVNQALEYLNKMLGGAKPIEKVFVPSAIQKQWRVKTLQELEEDEILSGEKLTDVIPSTLYGKYLQDVLDESSIQDIVKAGTPKFEAVTKDGFVLDSRLITNNPVPPPKEWRVKTEEEFLGQYGANWRSIVEWTIHNEKDVFFGQKLKDIVIDEEVAELQNLTLKTFEDKKYLSIKGELDPRKKGFTYPLGFKEITSLPLPEEQWKTWDEITEGDRFIILNSKEEYFTEEKEKGYRTYLIKKWDFKGNVSYTLPSLINPLTQLPMLYDNDISLIKSQFNTNNLKVMKKKPVFEEGKMFSITTQGTTVEILGIGYSDLWQEYQYNLKFTGDAKSVVLNETGVRALNGLSKRIENTFKPIDEIITGDRLIQMKPRNPNESAFLNDKQDFGYKTIEVISHYISKDEITLKVTGEAPYILSLKEFREIADDTSIRVIRNKPKYKEGQVVKSPSGLPDVEIKEVGFDQISYQYVYWVDVKGSGETLWNDKTLDAYAEFTGEENLSEQQEVAPQETKQAASKKTASPPKELPINWTYLGTPRPNYLDVLQILKKRRLSKDDKVQVALFFGELSMITKGTVDFINKEKNNEAEALQYGETYTPTKAQFFQRYSVYPDYQDLLEFNGIQQPTDLVTFDWIQDMIYPIINEFMDSSNDNLMMRNYIIETEKQNRGFALVENEVRAAEDAAKKPSKKSALAKYKNDDDDLESALEDLEI